MPKFKPAGAKATKKAEQDKEQIKKIYEIITDATAKLEKRQITSLVGPLMRIGNVETVALGVIRIGSVIGLGGLVAAFAASLTVASALPAIPIVTGVVLSYLTYSAYSSKIFTNKYWDTKTFETEDKIRGAVASKKPIQVGDSVIVQFSYLDEISKLQQPEKGIARFHKVLEDLEYNAAVQHSLIGKTVGNSYNVKVSGDSKKKTKDTEMYIEVLRVSKYIAV